MKGIVSALGISSEGILAAGTFTRFVGLYDQEGSGDCIAVFSLGNNDNKGNLGRKEDDVGAGVTQVLWSPCGRYLYVAERKSDRVLVYDVRVTGRRLASLIGRRAGTNQRLGVEVVQVSAGSNNGGMMGLEGGGSGGSSPHEIWAGGMDGVVRVWRGPPRDEGDVAPTWEWKVHDGMNVFLLASTCSMMASHPARRNADDLNEGLQIRLRRQYCIQLHLCPYQQVILRVQSRSKKENQGECFSLRPRRDNEG